MYFNQKKIKSFKSNLDKNDADYVLFLLVSLLIITSIIFSYSLSIYTIEYYDYNQFHFFIRQLVVGIVSILLMWYFSLLDAEKLVKNTGMTLFVLCLFLMMIMPFLPASMVTEAGGANRWIRLPGFSISPVEFFKIGFIYFLSWSFHRKVIDQPTKITLKDEFLLLSPYFLTFFVVVFIVAFLQKDLGQVVLLGIILLVLLIFANRSFKIFLVLGAGALLGLVALIISAPHRTKRIYEWWAMVQDGILYVLPSWTEQYLRVDDFREPYQIGHALNAIKNGGFFGEGLSNGDIKIGFLSEVHTDFVLAGISEEIGFLGLMFITIIMFVIVWRIFIISRRVENPIYHLFTLGIALMLIIAFLINSYGISGMIPIKGISVPFLSYGGSSMLAMSLSIGLVLSISKEVKKKKKKKRKAHK